MIAIVVGLSFVVLMLAFRSLVVPAKAAVMNLLSVAAAYGVVTFVFQEGHGATLIGLDGPIPIVSFVPLLMFAILFGLSMDYEVFLLTQIQEHYQRVAATHPRGDRGPGQHRPGDHLGGADHGLCLHELRAQRRSGGEGVRRRACGGDRDRRHARALPARAGGDDAARQGQLVDAGLARPARCPGSASRARATSPSSPPGRRDRRSRRAGREHAAGRITLVAVDSASALREDRPVRRLGCLALVLIAVLAAPTLAHAQERLTVSPGAVAVGQPLTIRGSGWPVIEFCSRNVRLSLRGGQQLIGIGTARTNLNGRFTFPLCPAQCRGGFLARHRAHALRERERRLADHQAGVSPASRGQALLLLLTLR